MFQLSFTDSVIELVLFGHILKQLKLNSADNAENNFQNISVLEQEAIAHGNDLERDDRNLDGVQQATGRTTRCPKSSQGKAEN